MKIECPFCQAVNEVGPESIGQQFNCSSCHKGFEVENPNLMPCPDCFGLISKRAVNCPHCGAPVNANSSGKTDQSYSFEEKVILVCHPSAKNYFFTVILGVVTSIVVIGLFILLYVWIKVHYTSYRITNRRIVVRRGLIAKLQNEIWIKDMRGANLVQGVWQRLLGIGDMAIGTAATAETEICMMGISDPQKVVDTINSLRR